MPLPILTPDGVAICRRQACPEWVGQMGLDLPGLDRETSSMHCRLMGISPDGDGSCAPYYGAHQADDFPEDAGIWERLEAAEELAAMRRRART